MPFLVLLLAACSVTDIALDLIMYAHVSRALLEVLLDEISVIVHEKLGSLNELV